MNNKIAIVLILLIFVLAGVGAISSLAGRRILMLKNNANIIAALIFAAALVLGQLYVNYSALAYTESAIIWLAAVLAGSIFWLGSRR